MHAKGLHLFGFFSAPILLGIAFGVWFPYQSSALTWTSSILLFALLFLNTLPVLESNIFWRIARNLSDVLIAQVLLFLFFPLIVAAAATLLIGDRDFVYGLVVSALAPSAFVAPFFAARRGGDTALTLGNVLISTLLCPLVTLPVLSLFGLATAFVEPRALTLYLLLLSVLPISLSILFARAMPRLPDLVRAILPAANSVILGLLMFTLVGSSLYRTPLRLLLNQDLALLAGFYVFMDFGIYALVRWGASRFVDAGRAEAMALSVGARNFAITAGLMLFFHPKAALPSAVGLVVHALFFQWLLFIKKK